MKHAQMLGLLLLLACGALPACHKPVPAPPHAAVIAPAQATQPEAPITTPLGIPPPVEPTVTFALPKGEVAADAPIVLAFSEPMVPLAAIDLPRAITGVTVTPDVPVQWRWVSTDTLVGQPQPGWPHAQPLHVHLAATLHTRAGRPLRQALDWDFHTAPPALVWTLPRDTEAFAPRDTRVQLLFDQPVDAAELRAHLLVTADNKGVTLPPFQVLPLDAKLAGEWDTRKTPGWSLSRVWPDKLEAGQLFAVVFAAALPPWQRITVTVAPGLAGKMAPIATHAPQRLNFGTAGGRNASTAGALEPFALLQVEDTSDPDPDIWRAAALKFSTPLPPIDQTRQLKAVPAVKNLRLQCYDTTCSIAGDFAPATTYTFAIAPQFEDAHGRRLGKPVVLTRVFGHRSPHLAIDTDGSVMELQQRPHAVALTLRNLHTLTARVFAVPADAPWSVLRALQVDDPGYAAALAGLGPPLALPVKPSSKADTIERRVIDLDALLAQQSGRVWLEVVTPDIVRAPGERWAPSGRAGRLFQVTDLHIAAKTADNESLFWVTSLQTGQPVAGARVELRDEKDSVLWRSTTNADGLVTGPGGLTWWQRKKQAERRVMAFKGDDAATLEVVEASEWAPERSERQDSERGWLFTDKPVYRPGETVQVKGLLRVVGKDGLSLPAAGREVTLQLRDPVDHAATQMPVRLSARGTFAAALSVPPGGRIGAWRVQANSQHTEFATTVQLAVYHVPRTRLEVTLKAQHVARGDGLHGEVLAGWFSGGPLDHAPVHVTASGVAEAYEPPGWPQFQFGAHVWAEDDAAGARNVLNHELRATTDERGRAVFQVPTGVAMDRPLHVEVAAAVQDPNGQDMSASRSFWLHPAAALVGVQLPSALVKSHTPLPVRVVASAPDGHAQVGLPLAITLLRREWKAIRIRGMGGETSWQTRLVTSPAGSCAVTSAALPVDCTLGIADAGAYSLQATVRDSRGRTARTTADFYAVGPEMTWSPDGEDEQLLIADKPSYKVGEIAHILVRNQAPGALALVTEERAGILRTRIVQLNGAAPTLDVPIEARHAPNVHIGVLVIAGRRSDGALGLDTGAPAVQLQAIELAVDAGEHRLQVTVTPEHKKALPGQKTTVEIAVRDAAGRPRAAEVTLWAVDEGVLALTGEHTPNPLTTLYAAIARGVEETVLMQALVRRRAGELKGDAGGGGGERGLTRTNLRDVALWQAALQLPADGKVRHSFTLPDNLTTWRIMAVAIDGPGDFGSGDAQVEAAKPLMLQPALPRSVAVGDEVELTATVRNRQAFTVAVRAQLTLTGPLALDGPSEVTLSLAPLQGQEVRFRVHAPTAGQAQVRWQATAKAAHQPDAVDAVEEPLEVRTLRTLETVASWAQVTGNRLDMLQKPEDIAADRGGLTVAVSGSLAVGAQVAISALTDYPFECTEQLASRLQALLALEVLRGDDKSPLPELAGEPKALAQKWLERIEARAHFDGGLSLWEGGEANASATLWALWVIADAKAAGLKVDQTVVERAAKWLRGHPSRQPQRAQVQLLAVEAAVGLADPATAEAFFTGRAQLGADEQLWLAAAYARLGAKPYAPQIRALLEPLLGQLHVDGESSWLPDAASAWGWSSPLQRQALLVEVLARVEPSHPLLPRLTRWLVRQQGGHGWRSTHENAWALRALVAQTQAGPAPDGDFQFLVGGKQRLAGPVPRGFHLASVEVPQGELPPGATRLELQRHGHGAVWLRLALSYALLTPPQEARNGGLLVRRRLFTLTGAPVTGPLHRGDQVIVQVEVTAGDAWDDVAIVDRPAAGLEPVDLQFADHDAGLARRLASLQLDRHARVGRTQHTELAGREVRFFADLAPGTQVFRYVARAANRGSFQDPGVRAEAMYRPDVFGTSGASTLRIN